jgi:dTDP-glucose pyrophosphorylase/predicted transcriptional regulator
MNIDSEVWRDIILPDSSTIDDAVRNLEKSQTRIVAVVNTADVFKGTVCDGDIRRGLLKGLNLTSSINSIVQENALIVPPEINPHVVRALMSINKVQQIPVVDKAGFLVGLHLWDEIFITKSRDNLMVIMAGGLGSRMLPHTEECPKPMLSVRGKPMLEHIIERAIGEGFTNFVLAVNYLGPMIKDYFGHGEKMGIKIEYLLEESPLGTAGALSLFDSPPDTSFIVTNGDVITDIRYGEVLDFHIQHAATATMAVRPHEWENPFGVVKLEGIEIASFEEKPVVRSHINAGVYVLNPSVLSVLTVNEHCDMPTLFERLQEKDKRTIAYPMYETWLDVGRPDDLKLANNLKQAKGTGKAKG